MKKILIFTAVIFFAFGSSFAQDQITCEQWKSDVEFYKTRLEKRHANLYHTVSKEEFRANLDDLKKNMCRLDDQEIIVRLSEITASIRDGHTWLNPGYQENLKFTQMPLRLEFFDDGIFVIGADSAYKNLIGKQIVSINSVPIEKIISEVRKVGFRENEFTEKLSVPRFIVFPAVLKRFGFIENPEKIDVTLRSENEKLEKITLVPKLVKDVKLVDFISTQTDLPLVYQNNREIYWHKYLADEKLLYLQFNSHSEDEKHNFKKLTKDLIAKIDAEKPSKFVIDLRRNGGGNSALTFPLISALTYFENRIPEGQIFVIISRVTYSASVVFASEVRKYTDAVFLGEPTGNAPNLYTENGYRLTLPNSRVEIAYSTLFYQSAPFDNSKWIAPDIAVKYRSADYFGLKQPIIEEILNYRSPEKSIYQTVYEYASNNQIEKALEAYNDFKADHRNKYVNTQKEMRRTASRVGRIENFENALKYARMIYELNIKYYPENATTRVNLGQLYEDLKDKKMAIETYEKAQKIIPVDKSISEAFRQRLTDFVDERLKNLKNKNNAP